MKKIMLGFTSLLLLCTTHFAAADTKINAGGIDKPYYIAPGCEWKLNGTGYWGKEYGLVCNGVYAATKAPTSSSSTPLTVTAASGYYVTTYYGTTPLSSSNDYNYAIYKSPIVTPSCPASSVWTKGPYTLPEANTALSTNQFYKTCSLPCKMDIVAGPSAYNLTCH